jgi:hypothetical protein
MLGHARRMSGWLDRRGVKTILWGDMLFAKGEVPDAGHAPDPAEARARRAGLPRGIVVADWHYTTGDRYPSLELLKREGLETIACTWHEPMNIYRFAQAARQAGVLGLLQTTWVGYFPDEQVLRSEARQFSAFILAAEYAWSGRPEPPAALPYDPAVEFSQAYFEKRH